MSDDTPKFSVLMAIYIKDSPLFLSEALQSIYKNTVAPDEVIIIRDGKVTSELNSVIDSWRRYLNIKDFTLEKNYLKAQKVLEEHIYRGLDNIVIDSDIY